MTLKQKITVLVIAMIIVIFGIIIINQKYSNSYHGSVEKIILGAYPQEYSTLIWVAENRGYFKKNGLDVTIKEYDSGVSAVEALVAGEVDLATAADYVFVSYSFKERNLRILSSMGRITSVELIARRDRGISKPAELKGKKIGTVLKSVGEFFLGTFLDFNHLSVKDVQILNFKASEVKDSITKGTVDAVIIWDPIAYNIRRAMGDKVISWPGQSLQEFQWLLISKDEFLKKQPLAAERFLKAMIDAEDFIEENTAATVQDIVVRRTKEDISYLWSVWSKYVFTISLKRSLMLIMEDQARWTIETKYKDGRDIPNYLNFIYLQGLDRVRPKAVTIIH